LRPLTEAAYPRPMAAEADSGGGGAGAALDLGRLYAECLPKVRAFAHRMLNDEEAARDVAQEAFATALAKATSFRGESSPLTWVLSIARNLCLQRLTRVRERSFADIEALVDREAEAPPAFAEAELRSYVEEVKNGCLVGLLQCLPVAQRCAFILHLLNDEPIGSVAKIMGKSENSIRILVSRARSSLSGFLCRNCALMGAEGRCSCDRMINFSLKRGLIERLEEGARPVEIAGELRGFADEAALYKSLPSPEAAFSELVASGKYRILSNP
jgi:RNA polymerase sigma factor (sigma-70 family)